MPSVLDRFKDTEKYPRQMRELGMLISLRDEKGLFLKQKDQDRCAWHGDVDDFDDAEELEHTFGEGTEEKGILFRTPRLIVLRGAYKDDTTFIENTKERNSIEGTYHEMNYLYDDWKAKHGAEPSPYRRRRLILCYLVNKNGEKLHGKPLYISLHGGAARLFVEKYAQFLEQLEGIYAKATGDDHAQGFGEKMASSIIWTPTFGTELYGGDKKSKVMVAKSWKEPTEKTILSFWPKDTKTIDSIEKVWEACPIEVYASKFFKQLEKEVGINALKPGVDLTAPALPAATTLGDRDPDTGEINLAA
jgi:hypothetical protein